MNPHRSETLSNRPTFTRQISSDSRLEMAPMHLRTTPPVSRPTSLLPQDVYTPPAQDASTESAATFPLSVPTLGLGGPHTAVPVPSLRQQAAEALRGHWRDLLVGGAFTSVVSWAIWATVKINRIDAVPYCIVDDSRGL